MRMLQQQMMRSTRMRLYYVMGRLCGRRPMMNESTQRSGGGKPETEGKTARNRQRTDKVRGLNKDAPDVRLSKTISWLLRHGAKGEGLAMRTDGYVKVEDLLDNSRVKSQCLDLAGLQAIVKADAKQRYALLFEPAAEASAEGVWWIRANQGHSITAIEVEMKPIVLAKDIPTGCAVHGTSMAAWKSIASQGLSKMKRNHIHLAQGVPNDNVISGMRKTSHVFVYIDVQKAIDSGIKFFLSDNGVVLTPGDESGFLKPQFFQRVLTAKNELLFDSTLGGVIQPIV